jgi:transcriptional regulator with GAF, ATPase, and Fis domain
VTAQLHSFKARRPFHQGVGSEHTSTDQPREREQAADDHVPIRRDDAPVRSAGSVVYRSDVIHEVLAQVNQVAPTNATVLMLGETGVGKEMFAQAIHDASPRRQRPMIRVSCAAIPTTLIESELFGHERGAFTNALSRQIGRFELANGSTIFLDEIGELPLDVQVKLLRVLQDRTIERLGGSASIKVDIRIIAATNRDLEQAVRDGLFREDLFYRLNVFPITVPPLRDRVDDIPELALAFTEEVSRSFNKPITGISRRSLIELQSYRWPGNVRELRNVIERAIILAQGPTLTPIVPRPLPASLSQTSTPRLVDVEAEHIRSVLDSCGWRVRGAGGAAERLGVKPTTLESRMARLGIRRNEAQLS